MPFSPPPVQLHTACDRNLITSPRAFYTQRPGSSEARLALWSYTKHSPFHYVPFLSVGPASVHQFPVTTEQCFSSHSLFQPENQEKSQLIWSQTILLGEVIQKFCYIHTAVVGKCAHYTHFTEGNTKSHGGLVTCPRSSGQ